MSSGGAPARLGPSAAGPAIVVGGASGGRGVPLERRVQPARRASSAPGARADASSNAVALVAPAAVSTSGSVPASSLRGLGGVFETDARPWGDIVTDSHGSVESTQLQTARVERRDVVPNVRDLSRTSLVLPEARLLGPMQFQLPVTHGRVPLRRGDFAARRAAKRG